MLARAELTVELGSALAAGQLEIHYQAYDESLNPYAKVREGLAHVATEYCSICADDDVVILPAIERCVAELERRSSLALAHGYYFNFIEQDAFEGAPARDHSRLRRSDRQSAIDVRQPLKLRFFKTCHFS